MTYLRTAWLDMSFGEKADIDQILESWYKAVIQ